MSIACCRASRLAGRSQEEIKCHSVISMTLVRLTSFQIRWGRSGRLMAHDRNGRLMASICGNPDLNSGMAIAGRMMARLRRIFSRYGYVPSSSGNPSLPSSSRSLSYSIAPSDWVVPNSLSSRLSSDKGGTRSSCTSVVSHRPWSFLIPNNVRRCNS